jgi:hypothetical protein
MKMLDSDTYDAPDFFVLMPGRHDGENGVLAIRGGRFRGYGFIDKTMSYSPESLADELTPADETRHIRNIIRAFIREKKNLKVVYY